MEAPSRIICVSYRRKTSDSRSCIGNQHQLSKTTIIIFWYRAADEDDRSCGQRRGHWTQGLKPFHFPSTVPSSGQEFFCTTRKILCSFRWRYCWSPSNYIYTNTESTCRPPNRRYHVIDTAEEGTEKWDSEANGPVVGRYLTFQLSVLSASSMACKLFWWYFPV